MAIPLGWEEVTLRAHNISLVKSHFNNLNHDRYFKYSHLIKTLAFEDYKNYGDYYKLSRLELLELLNLLPNLKEIDFSETNYAKEYLEYLLGADMQNINRIYTGFDLCLIQSDLLFSVYYKFRNSITCIRLLLDDRHTINFDPQQINILNSLNQFKKLTKLELYNLNDINLTPFEIQDSCPNLEHLKFVSNNDSICESAMRRISDNRRRINLNCISNLTYLELSLLSLSAVYTTYLVDYFPNQLTDLTVTICSQNVFNWIDIVGMEPALRLMEKAGSIEETSIDFLGCEEYQVQANDENNMTKYFKLLNSFRGTRQTQCIANFNEAIPETSHLGYSFSYNSPDMLFVTYNLQISDLYGSNTADMAVPDNTSSIIGPEIFHILDFNLLRLYYDDDNLYRVLNYSLSNCPRLRGLSVKWYLPEGLHSSLRLKHKEGKTSSHQSTCDISVLEIENITPAKTLFDLVTANLYNIEILLLRSIDWSFESNNPIIDLTSFKKLKNFEYTSTDNNFTGENKFALIKYTDGTEERRIFEHGKTMEDIGDVDICYLVDPTDPVLVLDIRINTLPFKFHRYISNQEKSDSKIASQET
ncbi:hypothetical protein EDC94DRAFT_657868 [Helicostylum pulchrum]|nr:hypothetical protein EDC94DRAFT_657868 [Helicostylum pulchrum]